METSRSSARTSEVVSIRSRSGYRPGFKGLASGQVLAARERLGLSHAAFADYLSQLLGWAVTADAAGRWERGAIPPGDVLLACAAVIQNTPADVLAFPQTATAQQTAALLSDIGPALDRQSPLLGTVPHSFPADALCGPWVTCYQFRHGGTQRHHADIAHITAESDRHIRATNHPPSPRTEGRASPFRNEIDAELAGRHLIGEWRNTSDTRYYGALQLAVLPGEIVMEGYYAGVGSDIEVSTGWWKWVRLDPGSIPDAGLSGVILREPTDLYELVMSHSQYGAPLALADVGEGA